MPIVERARPGNADSVLAAYAKRCYAMIGNSQFNSDCSKSEDSAIRQGQAVAADLVSPRPERYRREGTFPRPH